MMLYLKMKNQYNKRYLVIPLLILLTTIFSCQTKKNSSGESPGPGKEEMAELNRYLVQKDREIIQNYIERKGLKMTESPTGLWYYIEYEGEGKLIGDNDKIIVNYECSLLDGTKCYSSQTLGPKSIVLGKSELEPGLNEGLRLLKPEARALFILPPFLAYGFVGDGKKIPPRSIIFYEIKVQWDK